MSEKQEEKTGFEILRAIDVTPYLEKKGNLKLTYLSWSDAVQLLLEADPDAEWEFSEEKQYGETLMTYCTVTAFKKSRKAWLPVMDHSNNAVKGPTARQVNDTMQRCLVKAIALHGLGLGVYQGEDLPQEDAVNKAMPMDRTHIPAVDKRLKDQVRELSAFNGSLEELRKLYTKLYKEAEKNGCTSEQLGVLEMQKDSTKSRLEREGDDIPPFDRARTDALEELIGPNAQ